VNDCSHAWDSLNVFIRNSVIYRDGREEELANVAWCSRCGERWDLTDIEVAAAEAVFDGRIVVASNQDDAPASRRS
jgi:hypothetical protein